MTGELRWPECPMLVSRCDSALFDHHSLPGEFGNRFARFAEALAIHALQHCFVFRKLDIPVFHHLHAVPPGISELHSSPRQDFDAGFLELLPHLLLVVYHQAKMALFVWKLSPTFGESDELIAHVDESHFCAPPPKREFEQAAVERKRLFDVPHLKRHVVYADEPCFTVQILHHFHDYASGSAANVKRARSRRPCSTRRAAVATHQITRTSSGLPLPAVTIGSSIPASEIVRSRHSADVIYRSNFASQSQQSSRSVTTLLPKPKRLSSLNSTFLAGFMIEPIILATFSRPRIASSG